LGGSSTAPSGPLKSSAEQHVARPSRADTSQNAVPLASCAAAFISSTPRLAGKTILSALRLMPRAAARSGLSGSACSVASM